MASILSQSDFETGIYQLTQNDGVTEKLNESIARVEKRILTDLMGIELKAAYDVGIAESTPDAKWTDLRDGKTYDNTLFNTKMEYEGFKALLKPFTFSDYITNNITNTPFGQGRLTSRNTDEINSVQLFNQAKSAYNNGVTQYKNARDFIRQYKDDYDNWLFTGKNFK